MEAIDLKEIQKSLEEKRKDLLKSVQYGELGLTSTYSINPGRSELAWRYERSQRKTLLITRARDQLLDIEAAIKRLENDTYGICLRCSQPINPERLRALPSAAYCVRCQQYQEENRSGINNWFYKHSQE